jgi:hypothetical protein
MESNAVAEGGGKAKAGMEEAHGRWRTQELAAGTNS